MQLRNESFLPSAFIESNSSEKSSVLFESLSAVLDSKIWLWDNVIANHVRHDYNIDGIRALEYCAHTCWIILNCNRSSLPLAHMISPAMRHIFRLHCPV